MRGQDKGGIRMPIDFFFRSLAKVRQEGAIGIVLSGTASDGGGGSPRSGRPAP